VHTISRADRMKAIAFLVVGLLVIGGVCGLLIGLPLLKNTRQYFVRFTEAIEGIDKGTDVRYQGVKKGRVKRITIDFDVIQLELEVDADLPVTESTLARISSAGILPPYFVELRGSLRDSPALPEGAVIKTDPSAMTTFVEKGMQTLAHLETVIKNLETWTGEANSAKFAKLLDEASSAISTANRTMTTIGPDAQELVRNYAAAGEELRKLLAENRDALHGLMDESRKAVAEVNRFLESGRLDQIANEAAKTLESVRGDFTRATNSFSKFLEESKIEERLAQVVASFERIEKSLTGLSGTVQQEVLTVTRSELAPALASFREAMRALDELSRTLRNDPSLLLFSRPRDEIQIPRPGSR
jgi:phospholipid/cholesterol/gamma-HCH transport system substrate-binding protein